MAEYIEREAAIRKIREKGILGEGWSDDERENDVVDMLDSIPAANVLPVTRAELKYLMNDTIAYIWKLEDRGATDPMYGYDSRKALLEKLKKFYAEHFPEMGECAGRMDSE